MFHETEIIGNVGRDAEMRFTPAGAAVASFSVAVNEQYTSGTGETVKNTIWYRVSVWGKQAEVANQYVKKGMRIFVKGRLTADPATGGPRIWTNNSGEPQASFELNGREMKFLSSRGEYSEAQQDAGDTPGFLDEVPY